MLIPLLLPVREENCLRPEKEGEEDGCFVLSTGVGGKEPEAWRVEKEGAGCKEKEAASPSSYSNARYTSVSVVLRIT